MTKMVSSPTDSGHENAKARKRRVQPRWRAEVPMSWCVQWSSQHQDVALVRGWVIDVSPAGLGLRGPIPVACGWRVSVLLLPRNGQPELVEGRVAWAKSIDRVCSFGLAAPVQAEAMRNMVNPGEGFAGEDLAVRA